MSNSSPTCPAPRSQVVDLYFLEHRAKLIDIAAFLDRVDRADDDGNGTDDFRVAAFREALSILSDARPHRSRRILELLSDHSADPVAEAGTKGAFGANPAS